MFDDDELSIYGLDSYQIDEVKNDNYDYWSFDEEELEDDDFFFEDDDETSSGNFFGDDDEDDE